MSVCKCGVESPENVAFCPACGAALNATEGNAQAQAAGTAAQAQAGAAQADPQDVSANKTMAIISYLGILVLVPLLTGLHKTSAFTKYHMNQALLLIIPNIAWGIVYSILTVILVFIPVVGGLLITLLSLVWLNYPIFAIIGILNANNGVMKPLPFFDKFLKFTILK